MLDYPLSSKTHIQSVIKSYWNYHSGIFLLLSLYFSNPVLHPYPIYAPHCPWNDLRINLSWLISCNYCSYPTVYDSQYAKLFMICMSHNSFPTAPPYVSPPNYVQGWTIPPHFIPLWFYMCLFYHWACLDLFLLNIHLEFSLKLKKKQHLS